VTTEHEHFDGETFEPELDAERLTGQLARVKAFMADGQWHTLAEIAAGVGGTQAAVSARLRDLRKRRFGTLIVERERVEGANGLFRYRVPAGQVPNYSLGGALPVEADEDGYVTKGELKQAVDELRVLLGLIPDAHRKFSPTFGKVMKWLVAKTEETKGPTQ
jgi:hypothetical protein